ncbi:hypothetical protein ACFR9U_14035 [Halorientalis brevis]|uniref:Uncharacterized protein n=1 Tax=Halorientalis brevis TaxID=1126241 RepID=A0ABD6CDM5_9EURY|nr:hypothetical protein [Halorientalis brevis]
MSIDSHTILSRRGGDDVVDESEAAGEDGVELARQGAFTVRDALGWLDERGWE